MSDRKNNSLVTTGQHGLIARSSALATRGLVALQARQSLPTLRQSRWLNFPEDSSVGTVYIGEEATFWLDDGRWEEECEERDAHGVIEVPFGKVAELYLEVGTFSFIENMDPLALYSLQVRYRKDIPTNEWTFLGKLDCLSKLCIFNCHEIDDVNLDFLLSMQSLRSLEILTRQFTDSDMEILKSLTNLNYLLIGKCNQVKDTGFLCLNSLNKLVSLNLNECSQLTDSGLMYLKSLTRLEALLLSKCHQISSQAIKEFRQALPSCNLIISYS